MDIRGIAAAAAALSIGASTLEPMVRPDNGPPSKSRYWTTRQRDFEKERRLAKAARKQRQKNRKK